MRSYLADVLIASFIMAGLIAALVVVFTAGEYLLAVLSQ